MGVPCVMEGWAEGRMPLSLNVYTLQVGGIIILVQYLSK